MNACKVCGSYNLNIRAFKYGFDVYYLVECVDCRNKKSPWDEEEAIKVWNAEDTLNEPV